MSTPFPIGPLQRRLFLIAAVALIPVVLLALATLVISAQEQRDSVIRASTETMRALIGAVDAELALSVAALDTLAASPRLAAGDLAAFREEARAVLDRRPNWANVVLIDPDGQQLANLRRPQGEALPRAPDPEAVRAVARAKAPGIGNVARGPVMSGHFFTVRTPVLRGGEVVYVLSAVLRPETMLPVLERQRIPAQAVAAILDADGNYVARSRGHADWVGQPARPILRELLSGQDEAWSSTLSSDGQPIYAVFSRSAGTRWVAAAGLPLELVDGPATRAYFLLGGGIIGSLLLGLFAAYAASRGIVRPLRELGEAAGALGRGERPRMPRTDLPEVRHAAAALAAAHEEREELLRGEREARRHAEEASRLKDEFLAMLGHELRNPLSAISTAVQILDRVGDPGNAMARDAAGIVRRQSDHLARLTDDLLDAGRVMTGKILLERRPLDLAAAVAHSLATFRATGRVERHAVTMSAEPAWVEADATRVEQIASNLLMNALKYTPPGGSVQVSVRREGEQAVLRVRDDGIGLEADLLPRVFDLFVQGRRGLDRAQGGLGIGLTLVRRLVELHGGSVEARSEGPGRGAEFLARFPAIAERREAAGAAAPEPRTPRKVVIVEDNDDARRSLRSLLALDGHTVHEAADGRGGIELILRERPDIALVDIGLPGVDGYEVARAVRLRLGGTVRLLAVTGYGSEEDGQRAAEAGFDRHLVKPLSAEAISRLFQ